MTWNPGWVAYLASAEHASKTVACDPCAELSMQQSCVMTPAAVAVVKAEHDWSQCGPCVISFSAASSGLEGAHARRQLIGKEQTNGQTIDVCPP